MAGQLIARGGNASVGLTRNRVLKSGLAVVGADMLME